MGIAETPGRRRDRLEDRLHVRRRLGNHAQHFCRGRLLLERLAQLVEQPRILDGDHGLVGESLQQLDVVRVESARGRSRHVDGADRLPLGHQWYHQQRAVAALGRDFTEPGRQGFGGGVGDLNDPALARRQQGGVEVGNAHGPPCLQRFICLGVDGRERGQMEPVTFTSKHRGRQATQQTIGVLGNRLEGGPRVGGRARDHPQDFRGGRLLLQRLLQLGEQPHVLDGDHRLGGKGLQQFDLLWCEGTRIGLSQQDAADGDAFTQHRCRESGAGARTNRQGLRRRKVFGVEASYVGNMRRATVDDGASADRTAIQRTAAQHEGHRPLVRCPDELIALAQGDNGIGATAEALRSLCNCVQHRLHVGRRAGDHFEDVGGRGLLLERLRTLSSVNSRTFSMAMTAWAAKVSSSAI